MANGSATADGQQHVHEILSSYIDGDLAEEDARTVARHLESCPSCQTDYRTLLLTVQALRSLPNQAVPRSFTIPVHAAAPRRSAAVRWLGLSTGALAAAFVALLAVKLVLPTAAPEVFLQSGAVPTSAPMAASAPAPAAPAAAPTSAPAAPAAAAPTATTAAAAAAPAAPTAAPAAAPSVADKSTATNSPAALSRAAQVASPASGAAGAQPPAPTIPAGRASGGPVAPAALPQAVATPTTESYPVQVIRPPTPVTTPYTAPGGTGALTPASQAPPPTVAAPAAAPATVVTPTSPTASEPVSAPTASGPVWFTPGLGVLGVLALLSAAALTWLSRRRP